jgi:hypothetical protein
MLLNFFNVLMLEINFFKKYIFFIYFQINNIFKNNSYYNFKHCLAHHFELKSQRVSRSNHQKHKRYRKIWFSPYTK